MQNHLLQYWGEVSAKMVEHQPLLLPTERVNNLKLIHHKDHNNWYLVAYQKKYWQLLEISSCNSDKNASKRFIYLVTDYTKDNSLAPFAKCTII